MKTKILDAQFNDKNFWSMFDPGSAIDYFIPKAPQYRAQGVEFTISDLSEEKYIRDIEIWAEHSNPAVITMLKLDIGYK